MASQPRPLAGSTSNTSLLNPGSRIATPSPRPSGSATRASTNTSSSRASRPEPAVSCASAASLVIASAGNRMKPGLPPTGPASACRPNKSTSCGSASSPTSAALTSLVESWCQSATPVTLLLPLGRSLNDVLTGAGLAAAIPTAKAGALLQAGNLTIKLLPMTNQAGYDRLLWSCDLNLVRGKTPSCGPSGPPAPSCGTSIRRKSRLTWSSWTAFSTTIWQSCPRHRPMAARLQPRPQSGKTVAIGGRNGRNTPRYGCNMGDLGHRSSSGMGISSLGW